MIAMNMTGMGLVAAQATTWVAAAPEMGTTQPRTLIANAHRGQARQLAHMLRQQNHKVMLAHDRGLALRLAIWELPDLLILDAQLDSDGIGICASLKRDRRTCGIRIIITAQAYDSAEHLRWIDAGADDYVRQTDLRLLAARASALLNDKHHDETLPRLDQLIEAVELAVAAKDRPTSDHLRRLGIYAAFVGRRLGMQVEDLALLRAGARLHDIGKIGIDKAILQKSGSLTEDEYRQIQQHPLIGEQMIQPLGLPDTIRHIVRSHHERWDGHGYPDRLAGTDIPLGARIVAVIDSFDAMTSKRPYSQPLSVVGAIACLRAGAGSQWDSQAIAALVDSLGDGAAQVESMLCPSSTPQIKQVISLDLPCHVIAA